MTIVCSPAWKAIIPSNNPSFIAISSSDTFSSFFPSGIKITLAKNAPYRVVKRATAILGPI